MMMKYIEIEAELLWSLYWGNEYSQKEISNLFDISRSGIQKKMIQFNIPRRTRSDANCGNTKCGWNRGLTKETDERLMGMSKIMKKRWTTLSQSEKDDIIKPMNSIDPWLKGKTWEEDSRILHGKNHPQWKGGLTLKNYGYKGIRLANGNREKIWRNKIYERDSWTCQICHEIGGNLNAHHIKSWKDYPDDRYDIDNGITLCYDCHRYVHKLKPNNHQ